MTLPNVTVTEAGDYFLKTPRNADWVALADQQTWLHEAQMYLGQLCFDQAADCCGMTFADAWIATVSEVALALSKAPTSVLGGGAASTGTQGAIKDQVLGDLRVSYYDVKDGQSSTSKYGTNAPLILQKFPWISDLIGCYMKQGFGSSRVLSRCC